MKAKKRTRSAKEPTPLIEEAYRKIKQMIFQQALVPGQKLVYDDLAKMLNMSRTPIINALNRLEQQGLVASESFRGFYIKPMDVDEAWDSFGARIALEAYTVEQAIKRAGPDEFDALEENLLAHRAYMPNYYDRKKLFLDSQFHVQIAEMTKNKVIKWLLKTNFEHLYLRANLNNMNMARMPQACEEHRQLFERMKRKDIHGSIKLIRTHIETAREYVMECLSQNELAEEEFIL